MRLSRGFTVIKFRVTFTLNGYGNVADKKTTVRVLCLTLYMNSKPLGDGIGPLMSFILSNY